MKCCVARWLMKCSRLILVDLLLSLSLEAGSCPVICQTLHPSRAFIRSMWGLAQHPLGEYHPITKLTILLGVYLGHLELRLFSGGFTVTSLQVASSH